MSVLHSADFFRKPLARQHTDATTTTKTQRAREKGRRVGGTHLPFPSTKPPRMKYTGPRITPSFYLIWFLWSKVPQKSKMFSKHNDHTLIHSCLFIHRTKLTNLTPSDLSNSMSNRIPINFASECFVKKCVFSRKTQNTEKKFLRDTVRKCWFSVLTHSHEKKLFKIRFCIWLLWLLFKNWTVRP